MFTIYYLGEPPPQIVWSVDGQTLKDGRNVTLDNVDYHTKLIVRPVQRGDSGEYTITATNSSGKDSVTVRVTVTDKPSKPEGPLDISNVHKNGCKLKWKKPKDTGKINLIFTLNYPITTVMFLFCWFTFKFKFVY